MVRHYGWYIALHVSFLNILIQLSPRDEYTLKEKKWNACRALMKKNKKWKSELRTHSTDYWTCPFFPPCSPQAVLRERLLALFSCSPGKPTLPTYSVVHSPAVPASPGGWWGVGPVAAALDVAVGRMEGPLSLRACFRTERLKKEDETGPFTHPCVTEGQRRLFNMWLSLMKFGLHTPGNDISKSHEKKSQRIVGSLEYSVGSMRPGIFVYCIHCYICSVLDSFIPFHTYRHTRSYLHMGKVYTSLDRIGYVAVTNSTHCLLHTQVQRSSAEELYSW